MTVDDLQKLSEDLLAALDRRIEHLERDERVLRKLKTYHGTVAPPPAPDLTMALLRTFRGIERS